MPGPRVVHLNLPPVSPELARELLEPIGAEVIVATCSSEEEVVAVAADADAIIGAAIGRLMTRDVLSHLTRCRIVSLWSGSTDYLDLDAFTDHSVCVCFGADACTEEVADHSMALMLAAGRRLHFLDSFVRDNEGRWESHDDVVAAALPMPRLSTTTVGTLGFGRVGAALAKRSQGFGLRFLAYDPYISADAGRQWDVELTSKERVLAEADYIHICVPMKEDTVHIVGDDELRQMKPTAWLVNASSRATVIDEAALVAALQEGRLAGAALDNVGRDPHQPDARNPLLDLPNVVLTPHISHVSNQSYAAMLQRVCEDVVEFFNGRWPQLVANPAVKDRLTI
jgi:D-3-phosphoglycerate dehydrogenase / 2-oxoglutarate reductase